MKTLITFCSSIAIGGYLTLGLYVLAFQPKALANRLFCVAMALGSAILVEPLFWIEYAPVPQFGGIDWYLVVGLAVGALGLALTTLGLWRWRRSTSKRRRVQVLCLVVITAFDAAVFIGSAILFPDLPLRSFHALASVLAVLNLGGLAVSIFGFGLFRPLAPDVGDSVFRSLDDLVVVLDPRGQILKANFRFFAALNLTPTLVRNRAFDSLVVNSERFSHRFRDLTRGTLQSFDSRVHYAQGGLTADTHVERLHDRFGDCSGILVISRAARDIGDFQSKYKLTPRESEIVAMAIRGLPNPAIAGSLTISKRTVEAHLFNIYNKTGVSNKVELMSMASRYQGPAAR